MKFYRDWLIIDMDVYGLSLFLTLVLAFAFYFPGLANHKFSKVHLFILIINLFSIFLIWLFHFLTGHFAYTVIVSKDGISLEKKKGGQKYAYRISKEEIAKISRSKLPFVATLVIQSKNTVIWFNTSKQIERNLLKILPEVFPLFPPKGEYVKWDPVWHKMRKAQEEATGGMQKPSIIKQFISASWGFIFVLGMTVLLIFRAFRPAYAMPLRQNSVQEQVLFSTELESSLSKDDLLNDHETPCDIQLPQEHSYLDSSVVQLVKTSSGLGVYLYARPNGEKEDIIGIVHDGEYVITLAREAGYSFVLVKASGEKGWINGNTGDG